MFINLLRSFGIYVQEIIKPGVVDQRLQVGMEIARIFGCTNIRPVAGNLCMLFKY